MTDMPAWLPPLVLLVDYAGDWSRYVAALYTFFKQDFVDSQPAFQGAPVALKRHPMSQGKEATFWHLISEGSEEEERLPDLRRCERIRWPRPIVEHSPGPPIKVWENKRHGETRICLWLESCEYLVILAKRRGHVLLWTAYLVTRPHQKRKLDREYEAYKKANAAP
jgi:hypothetical protein